MVRYLTRVPTQEIETLANRESSANMTEGAYLSLRADLLACRILPGSKLKVFRISARIFRSGPRRDPRGIVTSHFAEGLVVAEPQRGFSRRADLLPPISKI